MLLLASADGVPYQLLAKRDLLERHLVDARMCGAEQRSGCDNRLALHGDGCCNMRESVVDGSVSGVVVRMMVPGSSKAALEAGAGRYVTCQTARRRWNNGWQQAEPSLTSGLERPPFLVSPFAW